MSFPGRLHRKAVAELETVHEDDQKRIIEIAEEVEEQGTSHPLVGLASDNKGDLFWRFETQDTTQPYRVPLHAETDQGPHIVFLAIWDEAKYHSREGKEEMRRRREDYSLTD